MNTNSQSGRDIMILRALTRTVRITLWMDELDKPICYFMLRFIHRCLPRALCFLSRWRFIFYNFENAACSTYSFNENFIVDLRNSRVALGDYFVAVIQFFWNIKLFVFLRKLNGPTTHLHKQGTWIGSNLKRKLSVEFRLPELRSGSR